MPTRVVYLFGAGASHACVSRINSPHGILTKHLIEPIQNRLRELVTNGFSDNPGLTDLVNSMDEKTDIEHLITFIDEIPSLQHRKFAAEMRMAFEQVLREKLEIIRDENQGDPIELYEVLLDLHEVGQFPEVLHGIITLNYDEYIETAIQRVHECAIDFGIRVDQSSDNPEPPRLLKLHGSLGWQDTWPISREDTGDATLWIPPGIQKAKQAYPFNVLWGSAREMLACDVLRVVGCRLGANDWDLISLLFSMRYAGMSKRPQIEIIDAPSHAISLDQSYPYLELKSFLEVEPVGSVIINEFTAKPIQKFDAFGDAEQQEILTMVGRDRNWFDVWLTGMVGYHGTQIEDFSSRKGLAKKFFDTRL